MLRRLIVCLTASTMALAACTSTPPSPASSDSSPDPAGGTGSPSSSVPEGTDEDGDTADPVDLPALPLLAPAGFGVPGEDLSVTADDRLEGELFLVGPTGDLSTGRLSAGHGTLSIPGDAANGWYGLRLEDDSAWGSVMVLGAPGLLLEGSAYATPGIGSTVDLFVHDVPDGHLVALELESSAGKVQRLVPHPLLGLAPAPMGPGAKGFAHGTHRIELPADFEGQVRLVAGPPTVIGDPVTEEPMPAASPRLSITACDEPSTVSGDLGQPGTIAAHADGSSIRSTTPTGRFSLDVDPGKVFIHVVLADGSTPPGSPRLVSVGCGEDVDLGGLEDAPAETEGTGGHLEGVTSADLWAYRMTASGDVTFAQESVTDCTMEDAALVVTFGASTSDPWLTTLIISPPVRSGPHDAEVQLVDLTLGEASTGTLSGELEIGRVEDIDAVGGAFSGVLDGGLGEVTLEVAFTCALFDLDAAPSGADAIGSLMASPVSSGAVGTLLALGADTRSGVGERCKRLFVHALDRGESTGVEVVREYWAATIFNSVQRLDVVTTGDMQALLRHEAGLQLLGASDSEGGGVPLGRFIEADYLLSLTNQHAGEQWVVQAVLFDLDKMRVLERISVSGGSAEAAAETALERGRDLIEPLSTAGICAEITPERTVVDAGEDEEFELWVTDLAGEPADSPEVVSISSECGTFAPESGAVDGDTWATTFTARERACAESAVSAHVTARGTVEEVEAFPEAFVRVEGLWSFSIITTIDAPHLQYRAEASGSFFVEPDFDALIGAGSGSIEASGDARCEANGAVTWQPFTLIGYYEIMVAGAVTNRPDTGGPWDSRFAPTGFDIVHEITYHSSSPCIEAGTYTEELMGSMTAELPVTWPHWLANEPDGFQMWMNPSGDTFSSTETLEGIPGASASITIWRFMS